jgi:hypothetical protein
MVPEGVISVPFQPLDSFRESFFLVYTFSLKTVHVFEFVMRNMETRVGMEDAYI